MLKTRKTLTILILSALLAQAIYLIALAAVVPIDHFDDGPVMSFTDSTGGGAGGYAAATVFSGERDVSVTRSGSSGSATVTIDPAVHYLEFSVTGGATGGVVALDYDGSTDHSAATTAIDGVTADLVDTNNFGFHVEIVQSSHPATLRIEAYSTAANWSYAEANIPGNIGAGTHVDLFVLFQSFVAGGSGPAVFTSIDALKIILTSTQANAILRLDFVEASTKRDFGDLPESYGEVSHSASLGTRLGNNMDTESSQQYSPTANGDDLLQADDEEGVIRTPGFAWTPGANGGSVDVNVQYCPATCVLAGWVDWNRDGNFAGGVERILFLDVTTGSAQHTFTVPSQPSGFYSARFRLFEQNSTVITNPQPAGDGTGGGAGTYAIGGEVEDYYWEFSPTAIELVSLEARSGSPGRLAWILALAVLICAPLLGYVLYLKRRSP